MTILITGASGFLGNGIIKELKKRKLEARCVFRKIEKYFQTKNSIIDNYYFEDINSSTDWSEALANIDCVIHCIGRAHIIKDNHKVSLLEYKKINVDITRNLAEQASLFGVKRFIFISTIGVNGICTDSSTYFKSDDSPAPFNHYTDSKYEAEKILKEISNKTGLEIVIIRPPLIYGPGVKGNFLRLLNLIDSRIPLPLSKINNLRSYIGLDNLVDLIIRCTYHPAAKGKIFLACDGEDLSTTDLIKKIAKEMKINIFLFYLPIFILRMASSLIGFRKEVDRLVESLQIDYSYTRKVLGWTPPLSLNKGLKKMISDYLQKKRSINK